MNLDKLEEIKKLDKGNVLGSVERLADQIEQAWEDVNELELPENCNLAKNVVIAGMGGSALGGRIIDSLILDRARTPIEVFTQYHAPNYVGPDTLFIASSYSGNTEETLTNVHEAAKMGAQIFGITTGGKLGDFLKKENLPFYKIKPKHNPSNQPRMALGYSVAATMAVLARCEFVAISDEEMAGAVKLVREFTLDFGVKNPFTKNVAKLQAKNLKNKLPILIASEHLVGAVHAFKNQLNEGAKTFSALFSIPELNHHLMEGLRNPAEVKKHFLFLFFESSLYSQRVQKRYKITREVVEKNEVEVAIYELISSKKLYQVFEILTFGSFVQFYLAMLYGLDPAPIPWVDYFKEKMA